MKKSLSIILLLILSSVGFANEITKKDAKDVYEKSIEKVYQWVEKGEGFVSEQAPLLCNEIIVFGRIQAIGTSLLGLAILIVSTFCLYKTLSKWCEDWDTADKFGISAGISMPIIVSTIIFCVGLYHFFMTIFAPRLFLLRELKDMIK